MCGVIYSVLVVVYLPSVLVVCVGVFSVHFSLDESSAHSRSSPPSSVSCKGTRKTHSSMYLPVLREQWTRCCPCRRRACTARRRLCTFLSPWPSPSMGSPRLWAGGARPPPRHQRPGQVVRHHSCHSSRWPPPWPLWLLSSSSLRPRPQAGQKTQNPECLDHQAGCSSVIFSARHCCLSLSCSRFCLRWTSWQSAHRVALHSLPSLDTRRN